jgi:hypothetical protein
MTSNPLVAARCGRRDAVAKQIGDAGPHREAVANGWANHALLLADDGLAPETGRRVIPGLTSQIDPKRSLVRSSRRSSSLNLLTSAQGIRQDRLVCGLPRASRVVLDPRR